MSIRDVARDEDSAPLDARRNRPAGVDERQRVGNPHQHRPPDSAAVRDRRLLGLPARARSRQPRAGRDHRPARRERRPRPHAADRGPGRPGRRAACGRSSSPTPPPIPASSTFPRRARTPIARSSACRSSTAACCRACSSSRPSKPRTFGAEDMRLLTMAGAQLAPIVTRGAHARPVRRPRASAAGRAGAEPVVELGPRHDEPVPRARSGAVADARQQPGRAAPADPGRQARGAGVAARPAQPHQLRLPPDAGVPALDAHLGRAPRRRALGAAGRLLLGRVRHPRVAADLLGRPRHPRRRSHQERLRSRHSARRRRPLLRPGLLPAAPRSRRLAARGLHRRRPPVAADAAGARAAACPSPSRSRRGPARSRRASGSSSSAATRCSCSTRTSTATSPRIAS